MIARAENREMVESLPIPLVPVETVADRPRRRPWSWSTRSRTPAAAPARTAMPQVVIDHHETGGVLTGVLFRDIRPHLGATSTIVTGYLLEQHVAVSARAGHGAALRDRVGDDGLPPRGQHARRRGAGLALPPGRQGPARPDPQPEAPPEPLRHVPARAGQRLPLPRPGRELVRPGDPARHHRRDRRLLHPVRPGELVAVRRPVREHAEALGAGRLSSAATRARSSATSSTASAPPAATTSAPAARSPCPTPAPRRSTRCSRPSATGSWTSSPSTSSRAIASSRPAPSSRSPDPAVPLRVRPRGPTRGGRSASKGRLP